MKPQVRQDGFTIIELLVASVIMVTILGALGSLFVSTSRAYRANDEASNLQQSVDAAGELLSYEIGLAGYKGSTDAASTSSREFKTSGLPPVPTSTLTIIKGSSATASDSVTVRYFEDRFTGTVEQLVITLNAIPSGGDHNLYRKLEKQNSIGTAGYMPKREPAVQDVHNLKVLRYVRKDAKECNTATTSTLAALKLELTFGIGEQTTTKQVVVGLRNTQNIPILPTLTVLPENSGC